MHKPTAEIQEPKAKCMKSKGSGGRAYKERCDQATKQGLLSGSQLFFMSVTRFLLMRSAFQFFTYHLAQDTLIRRLSAFVKILPQGLIDHCLVAVSCFIGACTKLFKHIIIKGYQDVRAERAYNISIIDQGL